MGPFKGECILQNSNLTMPCKTHVLSDLVKLILQRRRVRLYWTTFSGECDVTVSQHFTPHKGNSSNSCLFLLSGRNKIILISGFHRFGLSRLTGIWYPKNSPMRLFNGLKWALRASGYHPKRSYFSFMGRYCIIDYAPQGFTKGCDGRLSFTSLCLPFKHLQTLSIMKDGRQPMKINFYSPRM